MAFFSQNVYNKGCSKQLLEYFESIFFPLNINFDIWGHNYVNKILILTIFEPNTSNCAHLTPLMPFLVVVLPPIPRNHGQRHNYFLFRFQNDVILTSDVLMTSTIIHFNHFEPNTSICATLTSLMPLLVIILPSIHNELCPKTQWKNCARSKLTSFWRVTS